MLGSALKVEDLVQETLLRA
ncbi:hypothetical protein AB0940_30745 [Streptomyces sp. NPDC006656]